MRKKLAAYRFLLPARLTRVFLFLQLHLGLLAAIGAVLVQLAEIGLFGFQDAHGGRSRTALGAEACVHCSLSSRHSRATLQGCPKERKTEEDDTETPDLDANRLGTQKLSRSNTG